ncbi:MAG: N-acetylglucosamine-6-phosphate deacetylase [Acidobacteria bacterium]|nr:N-acetylglucosamine-6-phosphate deacetylase [Acidobacteriota bacterium]MBA3888542.1 N-acetylglucosamine-6-phosphate deacetylase [Acidobacteriota bacterium]
MILLSGAAIVLPDRILEFATLVVEGTRIAQILSGPRSVDARATHIDARGHYVVPGFIDVHVHGIRGTDTLDGEDAIGTIARRLPRHGVTAFCPTSVACAPGALRAMLAAVRQARLERPVGAARVLPAHLESNFINPDFTGAQPVECLRRPWAAPPAGEFSGADILAEIAAARPDVGIVTLAPEIEGGMDLVRDLAKHGHRVSLGHSGATYAQAIEAIEAGAVHATHLFNRMARLDHRAPGLAGAVLTREEVAAEIICDGVHVHPAMVRMAVAAKRPSGVLAITDGTAGSGFPPGTVASLGGRRITVGDLARLDDGTIAGSVLTMDRAFVNLVTIMGFSLIDAAIMCSTTPARALGLHGFGAIAPGAVADLVVLDRDLQVVHTIIGGELVSPASASTSTPGD